MALANILVPNLYNVYGNSQTLNSLAAQPVPGTNTLWINSANGHLWRDGVDLEANNVPVTAYQTFIPAANFAYQNNPGDTEQVFNANLDSYLQLQAAGGGGPVYVSLNPMMNSPANLKLASFSLVYAIIAPLTAAGTAELSQIQYANTVIPAKAIIATTGGPLNNVANVANQVYITTFNVTNPVTLANNSKLNLVFTLNLASANASIIRLYGIFCNYST